MLKHPYFTFLKTPIGTKEGWKQANEERSREMEGKEKRRQSKGKREEVGGTDGGRRRTKIKQDAGSPQTVGEQWHERAELEITHCSGTSEEAQNTLTSSHTQTTDTHKPACMHANTHIRPKMHIHTVGNCERSQRRYNKEKSVWAEHLNTTIITTANTDWPLLLLLPS